MYQIHGNRQPHTLRLRLGVRTRDMSVKEVSRIIRDNYGGRVKGMHEKLTKKPYSEPRSQCVAMCSRTDQNPTSLGELGVKSLLACHTRMHDPVTRVWQFGRTSRQCADPAAGVGYGR